MAQIGQFPRLQAGLLAQLPKGGGAVVLPRVQLAGGQLQQQPVERIALLPHQRHVVRLIQCQNGHAPWVEHHLPLGGPPVRQAGGIQQDRDDPALEHRFAFNGALCQVHFPLPPRRVPFGAACFKFRAIIPRFSPFAN